MMILPERTRSALEPDLPPEGQGRRSSATTFLIDRFEIAPGEQSSPPNAASSPFALLGFLFLLENRFELRPLFFQQGLKLCPTSLVRFMEKLLREMPDIEKCDSPVHCRKLPLSLLLSATPAFRRKPITHGPVRKHRTPDPGRLPPGDSGLEGAAHISLDRFKQRFAEQALPLPGGSHEATLFPRGNARLGSARRLVHIRLLGPGRPLGIGWPIAKWETPSR